jgi:Co/Zn/Cd efflux system component
MDCPSEENLIRLKLNAPEILHLDFDLSQRELKVYHQSSVKDIERTLDSLGLGSRLLNSEKFSGALPNSGKDEKEQKRLLLIVLAINFTFFLFEIVTGFISQSMGLIADSLDMLADALVYGISLAAIGAAASRKKSVAKIAGYLQITLALLGFSEVLRRYLGLKYLPDFQTMMIVSSLALAANTISLLLLQKSKGKEEAHIQASLIFTSNDIIINLGVIIAGSLVYFLHSPLPDLLIGCIVFFIVIRGARSILSLAK